MNPPTRPRLFAHRGSSILAPENTAIAFDLACSYHCDVLETDVRLSRDHQLVVTHDETLERTTDGSGRVREHSLSKLLRLDAAFRFRDADGNSLRGQGVRLLTLAELFERYPHTAINIDLKDRDPAAAEALAKLLHKQAHPAGVTVGSFHAPVLKQFRQLAPTIPTAATRGEVARVFFGGTVPHDAAFDALQIPTRFYGLSLTGKRMLDAVRQGGKQLIYWTVNDPEQMRQLLASGVDGLVTDRPDLALQEFRALGHK